MQCPSYCYSILFHIILREILLHLVCCDFVLVTSSFSVEVYPVFPDTPSSLVLLVCNLKQLIVTILCCIDFL